MLVNFIMPHSPRTLQKYEKRSNMSRHEDNSRPEPRISTGQKVTHFPMQIEFEHVRDRHARDLTFAASGIKFWPYMRTRSKIRTTLFVRKEFVVAQLAVATVQPSSKSLCFSIPLSLRFGFLLLVSSFRLSPPCSPRVNHGRSPLSHSAQAVNPRVMDKTNLH